ncbi:MAG: class I SAM-dependent methyltransferase [Terriglobia bacterium]
MGCDGLPVVNLPAGNSREKVDYRFGNKDHTNAATYDAVRYIGPSNEYRQAVMASAYRKLLGPLRGKRILDVGCGTGRGVVDFAREADFAVGCDASLDMLSVAAQKSTRNSRCALLASYAQKLPFKDASFDIVTSLNFLHLFDVPTQRSCVAEMKRVLKPGGILVLEFTNALNGLVVGLFRRWIKGVITSLPSEIKQVIGDDCEVVQIHGAPFPILWRLFHRLPRAGALVERLGYVAPFNHMCHQVYYKASR